ncbi:death domain-containing protein 1 [Heteronotia binoei]|uniref:death domain-containing protein 1 n=1 Tax=Heteronotia binoei TaxID=13085 RepID=UPI002931793A|nr:death domain-containing protein 1 [Heteronotia binoei]
MENADQILEQIRQQNLTLREELLQSDQRDSDKIVASTLQLAPLLLGLINALGHQLESVAESLQNTRQLLNTLQENGWQQIPSPERSSLSDWLLEFRKNILHTLGHLGEAQDKLLEMNYKKMEKVQVLPCIPGKTEQEDEKETFSDVQMLPCVSQPYHEPFSTHGEENRAQLTENEAVDIETVLSLNEKVSGPNQKYPPFTENEAVANTDNRKVSPAVRPSSKKPSENIDLEDIPGNNEGDITASKKLENIPRQQLEKILNLEKTVESKEVPKQAGNGKRRRKAKRNRKEKDVNPKKKSHKSGQSNQEGECGSTGLEDIDPNNTTNLFAGRLEDEDSQSDWMMKEFLVQANDISEPEVACCITAPCAILENLVIKDVNDLSSLVVDDAEELVSNVISAEFLQDGPIVIPPVTIAIPFNSRYRGMYKDIMVKVTDENFQSSYLTPVSFEGHQGNHKGTFAEIKTSQLGTFSVVSCLKLETLTIPRKGLSRKLSMDPRMSFDFPASVFSSCATMHVKVQPIEPSILSLLRTKQDVYHSVVSTSPLVQLQHPSDQPFNKSATVILPCPPNPEKKRDGDETDHGRATSASIHRVTSVHHFRAMSASPRRQGDHLNESLKLLGCRSKEEGWTLLDEVTVRNVRSGLVSFELNEHLESFIVVRQSSAMDKAHLAHFVQHLEEDTHNTLANVVLYQHKEDPYKIIILLVPSKELNPELQSLREEGFSGPPEPSPQFRLKEGEQVHFRFSGNIFASDDGITVGKMYRLTFHAQRKPRLGLQIKEVDEYGNYSSPHFKGTALFYKVSKEAIAKNLEQPLLPQDYQHQEPVCKLALTLPKKEKIISRPQSTKRMSKDPLEALWDSLLLWLSGELSEDNASSLALFLPLRRSTLQFIKLKCPDDLTEQIYEVLCFWKRNLPRSADKLQLLTRYLDKSGRSDLAEDLRFRWENKVFPRNIRGQQSYS